ncbi:trehalose-phosphatase [soil metagenome]
MPTSATRPSKPATTGAHRLPVPPVRIPVGQAGPMALFLDMDGVLAPFAPTPEAVVPTPRRTAVLKRLQRALEGRMAVISGRSLAEIDRLTGGAAPSASGVHGLERRRRDGSMQNFKEAPGVREAVAAFDDFAADNPGVIVEDKGVSAGLHFRQAPEAGDDATRLAHDVADRTGLALQAGSMVLELKTPGADKGSALTAFMAEVPFKGAVPIMVGDDLTDEHAFRAAAVLGGFGILVGPARETAARYGLEGVEAVLDWLEAVGDACETMGSPRTDFLETEA